MAYVVLADHLIDMVLLNCVVSIFTPAGKDDDDLPIRTQQ